jgi:hypothetical protein
LIMEQKRQVRQKRNYGIFEIKIYPLLWKLPLCKNWRQLRKWRKWWNKHNKFSCFYDLNSSTILKVFLKSTMRQIPWYPP